MPPGKEKRLSLALMFGADRHALLPDIFAEDVLVWLRQAPAIETLRRVWVQQYYAQVGAITWRTRQKQGMPRSDHFTSSSYDLDAHLARKRSTHWIGYKVPLTESCGEDQPHLITHVKGVAGPVAGGDMAPDIHQALSDKDLLPKGHLLGTGYIDAKLLAQSKQDHRIDLVGPTRPDYKWQARAEKGLDAGSFDINWERKVSTCPGGRTIISWTPAMYKYSNETLKIKFSVRDCKLRLSRLRCTLVSRRTINVRRQDHHMALEAVRAREKSAEFALEYAQRAGIEGTISQGVRSMKLRRARYVGLAKTRLEHIFSRGGDQPGANW